MSLPRLPQAADRPATEVARSERIAQPNAEYGVPEVLAIGTVVAHVRGGDEGRRYDLGTGYYSIG